MFRNTLTFKFGKTIGLFYLLCIAVCIFTIIAEKLYYAIQNLTPPSHGLFFVVIILLNVFVILTTNFLIIEFILLIIDCFRLKKIKNLPVIQTPLPQKIFECILFILSIIVPFVFFL